LRKNTQTKDVKICPPLTKDNTKIHPCRRGGNFYKKFCKNTLLWFTTFLYEFTTEDGNILIWKTSKWLDDEKEFKTVSGTVKAHNEFRGVKQTELTRCKVA